MQRILVAVIIGVCAPLAAAEGGPSDPALIARGESIYFGTHPSIARPGAALVQGAPIPASAAACVACHRRSGLGSSESKLLVPPVAGLLLFNPLLPQTGRRLPWTSQDRTRPAYDEAALLRALNEGVAPDGVPLAAPMPRYALDRSEVAALAAYLRTLSSATAPGVSAEYTTEHVGDYLAITLNGKVISAPQINGAITTGDGVIIGDFTRSEAQILALELRSGALAVPMVVESISTEIKPLD